MFNFQMSEKQARNLHTVVDSHCQSLKNWTASRVEAGDLEGAKKLVEELREYQALFAAFNMDAKHDIAKHTSKPLETSVVVADRSR